MRNKILRATVLLGVIGVMASCSTTQPTKAPALVPTPANAAAVPARYLPTAAMPSSLALVPAPPAQGSAALALDQEINRSALAMHGTPRWDLATRDAVLTFPALAQTFSCVLKVPVSEQQTPKLITLLRRVVPDAGRAPYQAKQRYQRARPFMENGKPICTPDGEAALRRDGSYPSGHSSIGWALGLVLSQVSPEQTSALIARGGEFGRSRLVCNVHWQSDVLAGQTVGSAVVARLNAESSFRDDVAAARAEIEALRATGAAAGKNCDAEAQVLKSWN